MFLCLRSVSWGLIQLLCRPYCFLSKAFRFSSTVFAVCLSAALSLSFSVFYFHPPFLSLSCSCANPFLLPLRQILKEGQIFMEFLVTLTQPLLILLSSSLHTSFLIVQLRLVLAEGLLPMLLDGRWPSSCPCGSLNSSFMLFMFCCCPSVQLNPLQAEALSLPGLLTSTKHHLSDWLLGLYGGLLFTLPLLFLLS